MTPIKDEMGRVIKFVGVQVDVTNKTEGRAYTDSAGVPMLVHYDDRWGGGGGGGGLAAAAAQGFGPLAGV